MVSISFRCGEAKFNGVRSLRINSIHTDVRRADNPNVSVDAVNSETSHNIKFCLSAPKEILSTYHTIPQKIRALVIGINKYDRLRTLNNAVRDARSVKEKLEKSQNVDVIYAENCDSDELKSIADEFVELTEELDGTILFFAGHACVYNNCNRLLSKNWDGEVDNILEHSVNVLSLIQRLVM